MEQKSQKNKGSTPRLITYNQLEQRYGIKVATAVSLVREGRIPHVRFGRRFIRAASAACAEDC
jgi:hypothetical protein